MSLSKSKLLAILSFKSYKEVNTSYIYYNELLQWMAHTSNSLLELNKSQISMLEDLRLLLISKEHDLEATKRELAAIRDKYGI